MSDEKKLAREIIDADAPIIAANAAERLNGRPIADFDKWLTGERLRNTPIAEVLEAVEANVVQLVIGMLMQLAPHQRETAALTMLQRLAAIVRQAVAADDTPHEGGAA